MTGKSEKKAEADKKAEAQRALEESLAAAEAKAEENLAMARLARADLDNYRKRAQREAEEYRKYAAEGIVRNMLGVSDDLERALASPGGEAELREGVGNIRRNLWKILEDNGLTEIPTDGAFDPAIHEAMCVTDGERDGEIAEVFQKGYRMHGRVLRFAKVRVTRKAEPQGGEDKNGESERDV